MMTEWSMAVAYIRLVAAHWRGFGAWVGFVLGVTLGVLLYDGRGRGWEARAQMGVEGSADLVAILKARITSGDITRRLRVDPSVRMSVEGGSSVLDIIATARDGSAAVTAANGVLDTIMGDHDRAVQARDQAIQAHERAALDRETARERAMIARQRAVDEAQAARTRDELANLRAGIDEWRGRLRTLDEQIAPLRVTVEQSSTQATTGGRVFGEPPEERRLRRLESERERTLDTLDRLQATRAQLSAPVQTLPGPEPLPPPLVFVSPPVAPPAARAPGLFLHRIDRAVSATRRPMRAGWSLGAAGLAAVVSGLLALGVMQWWQEVSA